ncbi:hypothetical protein [Streptomyces aurantiogriseus]|uniref:Uncharacterized protein n=1 Tax=Streptomyces aurantiogriseus TaxID=66870 RepID=A0A918BSW2_9ACTN|nr:hypothetical protein [Streptomyces aurantiogriseus]GGQ89962.1 hypothetical protein GCM10010251_00020 [Streptomyces aurantiogriseus]
MDTATPRGSGGCSLFGVAVAAAAFVTVWWGCTALITENFGNDCLFYFGVTGPQAEHCYRVNDRAEAWLPWLVSAAWISTLLNLLLPRWFLLGRRTAAGIAVASLILAVVLGAHAIAVSGP